MKLAIQLLALVGMIDSGLIIYAHVRQQPLPHRQINELTNWGQGRAPECNVCPPGTIRFETDEGLFLECFRTGANR